MKIIVVCFAIHKKKLHKCMFEMTNTLKNEICKFIDYCLKNDYIHTRQNVDERNYLCEQLFLLCCCDIMKMSKNILIDEQSYHFHFELLNTNLLKKSNDEMLCIIFYFDTIEYANSKCNYKFMHIVDVDNDNEIYNDEYSKQYVSNMLNSLNYNTCVFRQ